MFYTINSSPMLDTKSVFKLIFVLSNYQTCTFPLIKFLEKRKRKKRRKKNRFNIIYIIGGNKFALMNVLIHIWIILLAFKGTAYVVPVFSFGVSQHNMYKITNLWKDSIGHQICKRIMKQKITLVVQNVCALRFIERDSCLKPFYWVHLYLSNYKDSLFLKTYNALEGAIFKQFVVLLSTALHCSLPFIIICCCLKMSRQASSWTTWWWEQASDGEPL